MSSVDELAPELAGAEPGTGVSREEIDMDIAMAARLSTEFGTPKDSNFLPGRASSTATEAAKLVAVARLALAEAEKHKEELGDMMCDMMD